MYQCAKSCSVFCVHAQLHDRLESLAASGTAIRWPTGWRWETWLLGVRITTSGGGGRYRKGHKGHTTLYSSKVCLQLQAPWSAYYRGPEINPTNTEVKTARLPLFFLLRLRSFDMDPWILNIFETCPGPSWSGIQATQSRTIQSLLRTSDHEILWQKAH